MVSNSIYKISISGKANSGKNTLSRLLAKELRARTHDWKGVRYLAFADPLKEMARTMFPQLPRKFFYGASKFRSEIIPGAIHNEQPLTIRQLLINLGTDLGRKSKEDVWLDNFEYRCRQVEQNKPSLIVCPDQRFINEWGCLKKNNFYQIRLLRNNSDKINDISEKEQELLNDDQYDFVVHNDETKADLKKEVIKIIDDLILKRH